jgi:hypothetical protein
MPSRRARSAGLATSATAPCATDTLAPDAPSRMRPTNTKNNDPAAPVMKLPTAVPNSDSRITGLRPMRSLRRPSSGEHTNCATLNDANNSPMVSPDAPKRSAYNGRMGATMPKPMRSMATVVQITP